MDDATTSTAVVSLSVECVVCAGSAHRACRRWRLLHSHPSVRDFYTIGLAGGVETMSTNPMAWDGGINPKVSDNQRAQDCLLPMGTLPGHALEGCFPQIGAGICLTPTCCFIFLTLRNVHGAQQACPTAMTTCHVELFLLKHEYWMSLA